MKHADFKIGLEFTTDLGERRWRCTDVGTRTIACIRLVPGQDKSWYNGPPYAVLEQVFDEYDFDGCEVAPDQPAPAEQRKAS